MTQQNDDLLRYKSEIIEEIEFLLIMAQKNDKSIVPGLEIALQIIEGAEHGG
jgi:hypothetical protein